MATALKLRNTTLNGITDTGDSIVYDMVDAFGASADTAVTNTQASGTEIQLTKTAGGSTVAWISGRVPAGGFTLTATDISAWQHESNMLANIGGRYRVFRYQPGPTITELGGGPFNDGVEMNTSAREDLWAGNVTDQAFSENDRILLRLYLTNVGTMASGHTGTLTFNAASAATGDSFFNIAETVAFKSDPIPLNGGAGVGSYSVTGIAASTLYNRRLDAASGSHSITGTTATTSKNITTTAASGAFAVTGTSAGTFHNYLVVADAGSYSVTGTTATTQKSIITSASSGAFSITGITASTLYNRLLTADAGSLSIVGTTAVTQKSILLAALTGMLNITGQDVSTSYSGGSGYSYGPPQNKMCMSRARHATDNYGQGSGL